MSHEQTERGSKGRSVDSRMTAAAGYIRCSTEQQEDSPDQQRRAILAFASSHGLDVVDWYVDFGKSGTTFDERPEFQRLRHAIQSGPHFKTVICYDESRWGRAIDAEENTYWRVHFRRFGVEVLLVKTSVDPGHEFAPMLKAFEGMQASGYSKKLSELTLRGAFNNNKFSSGGTAPYGYRRVATNLKTEARRELADGEWCVKQQEKVLWVLGDPAEVETVRRIFRERISGRSLVAIAKILNDSDVPCARRGRWRNSDQKWSQGTIKSILQNPVYRGARVYNRFSSSKIRAQAQGRTVSAGTRHPQWRNRREDWKIHEDAHDPIISKSEWEKANATNTHLQMSGKPRHNVPYLLSGLTKCSRCGFHFQGQSTRFNRKSYYRYVCGGYNSKRICDYCAVNRDMLEGFVLKGIEDILLDNAVLNKAEEHLSRLFEVESNTSGSSIRIAEQRLQQIKTKINRLYSAIEEGAKFEQIAGRLQELEKEKLTVEADYRGGIQHQSRKRSVGSAAAAITEFSQNFRASFDAASPMLRKELIRRCVGSIIVDRDAKVVRCYFRRIPLVGKIETEILRELENAEGTPFITEPLRTVGVPGTGLEPARPRGH